MDAMKTYREWLANFADDSETTAELKAIENDVAEIEDRFYRDLEFGTAGMRGVLGAGTNRYRCSRSRYGTWVALRA